MRTDDRQELVFNYQDNQWYRVCRKCINEGAMYFPDPPPKHDDNEENEENNEPRIAKVIPFPV